MLKILSKTERAWNKEQLEYEEHAKQNIYCCIDCSLDERLFQPRVFFRLLLISASLICLCVCLPLCSFARLCQFALFIRASVFVFIVHCRVRSFVGPSVCQPFVCLSIRLPVRPALHPCIRPPVCPSRPSVRKKGRTNYSSKYVCC